MAVIVYGVGHLRTSQGILKLLEAVACFVGFLLMLIDGAGGAVPNTYIVAALAGAVAAVLLLLLHVTKTARAVEGLLSYQLYFHFAWFVFLLVVSSIVLSRDYSGTVTAAGVLGVVGAVLYLIDYFDCFRIDPSAMFCVSS